VLPNRSFAFLFNFNANLPAAGQRLRRQRAAGESSESGTPGKKQKELSQVEERARNTASGRSKSQLHLRLKRS